MVGERSIKAKQEEFFGQPFSPRPRLHGQSYDSAVDLICHWVLDNFVPKWKFVPEKMSPYLGPYKTRDIITIAFPDSTEHEVTAALKKLAYHGDSWILVGRRTEAANLKWKADFYSSTVGEWIKAQADETEWTLDRLPLPPAGIGHNLPPEEIEIGPLSNNDRSEAKLALQKLQTFYFIHPSNLAEIQAAATTIEAKREKVRAWLLTQANTFTKEAVKESGKQFGKWAPTFLWVILIDQMLGLSRLIRLWLTFLH